MVYLVIYLLYRCMVLLNERACHVITKENVLLKLIIMILLIHNFRNNRFENYILKIAIQEYVKCFKQLELCG